MELAKTILLVLLCGGLAGCQEPDNPTDPIVVTPACRLESASQQATLEMTAGQYNFTAGPYAFYSHAYRDFPWASVNTTRVTVNATWESNNAQSELRIVVQELPSGRTLHVTQGVSPLLASLEASPTEKLRITVETAPIKAGPVGVSLSQENLSVRLDVLQEWGCLETKAV